MRFFVARERLYTVSLVGYSMGGNLVLKLAGELGADAPPRAPLRRRRLPRDRSRPPPPTPSTARKSHLRAEVSSARCSSASAARPRSSRAPSIPARADGIRSLREFDDRITALYSGFTGADDYYYRAAAARVLDRIAVPTLILHALDDPFVRLTPETRASILANPNITLLETEHGGHCAFLARPDRDSGYDGYWAEHTLLRFLLAHP